MAKSGLAAAEVLMEHGARVEATDIKTLEELKDAGETLRALGVRFERQAPALFENRDLIVISPGVPADLAELESARGRGVPVISELELAWWYLEGPTIGVTGANGKTTTTAMIGHILKECGIPRQVGGNIGTPPAAMIGSSRRGQWNVFELSSFQLETIDRFRAEIGVVTNVTPDHLDRHHTMEAYIAAKGQLFRNQREGDFAVLNAEDAACRGYAAAAKGQVVWFSLSKSVAPGAWFDGEKILLDGERLMTARDIPLRGKHNIENAMAAAGAARLAGAEPAGIAAALGAFPGVEHRLEYTRTVRGVEYYNDSKATNVDATLKAVDAFEGGLWIILGGKDKGSDYRPLVEPLRRKARAALLIGKAAPIITAHLGDALPVVQCGDLGTAVRKAHEGAQRGDTVLLAPACASFDQFQDFEHRGKVFKELIAELED
jgi:UDP-N-acetylmuramoylalanine--D-glutamate ligase